MQPVDLVLLNSIVLCPRCRGELTFDEGALAWSCSTCTAHFESRAETPNFLLSQPLEVDVPCVIGADDGVDDSAFTASPPELLVPNAVRREAIALDFGCGAQVDRSVIEAAGYRYVGIDAGDPGAHILADGQRLPFRAETFDLVYTMATLEHVRYPPLAIGEISRVLRPGGHLVGASGWTLPYVERAYFSSSHVGLASLLVEAGLEPTCIWGDSDWPGIQANFALGLFPRTPDWISKVLAWPLKRLSFIWWRLGGRTRRELELRTAGELMFHARKQD